MKKIKYYLNTPVNTGTENAPQWEDRLSEVELGYSEANLAIAEKEAHNSEYTVVESEDVPSALTMEERITALEKTVTAAEYTAGSWYYRGDKVTFQNEIYTCIAPAGTVCVWSPAEYPAYWQKA